MNLPNKLSLTRMALIPVMVLCMYLPGWPMVLVSAAVFGAAAYTDYLDGHIARRDGYRSPPPGVGGAYDGRSVRPAGRVQNRYAVRHADH